MGIRRPVLLLLLAPPALAACGHANASGSLSLQKVPLVSGATIVSRARECDGGKNPYCAVEAVIVDRRFTSSGALTASEDHLLHRRGWKSSAGDDGDEVAADSPGQTLRVTYATAINDLIGIDEKWITRSDSIKTALDQIVFKRQPAMSIMLELGPT